MKGIDISVWQQNINYLEVKASGIEFAIIRCGYGKNESQKDKMFETHYAGCKYAGLRVGAYLYSYATSVENARKEAENCLKFIKDKEFDLPIFYDLEDKITKPLGKETITQMAQVFCETIEKAGYKAGIYANLDWFTNYIDIDKVKQYKIWLAQWSNKHTTKFDIDYWQYTSKGEVKGISGNVDMNICYDIYSDTDSVVENVQNSVNKTYTKGKVYTTTVDLNVRSGAGTNYPVKKYSELTADGKKHAYIQTRAVLRKGTRVTCLDTYNVNGNIWLRIPSGFIAGYYDGKEYVG